MGKGFTRSYLSTLDKQDFYSHLGYSVCAPIVFSGPASSKLLSSDRMDGILHIFGGKNNNNDSNDNEIAKSRENNGDSEKTNDTFIYNEPQTTKIEKPPPPPPSPMKMKAPNKIVAETWMTKELKA
eukprot:TRINITY_DN2778_c0_g3_i2.p1 TRINITY_DN2778_c0_g3~~TRINITY_DN2778_c0_g3_i2.p1  ORF type:complete len:126 (-),score=29.62 TRINITY_DN2778_c0_g3_i2:275-652(-)